MKVQSMMRVLWVEMPDKEGLESYIYRTNSFINFKDNIEAIAQNYEQIRPLLDRPIRFFPVQETNGSHQTLGVIKTEKSLRLRFKKTKQQFIMMLYSFSEYYLNNILHSILTANPSKIKNSSLNKKNLLNLIIKSENKRLMVESLVQKEIRELKGDKRLDCFEELGFSFNSQLRRKFEIIREIRNRCVHHQGQAFKDYEGWQRDESGEILIDDMKISDSYNALLSLAQTIDEQVLKINPIIEKSMVPSTPMLFEFEALNCPLCGDPIQCAKSIFND